MKAQLLRTACLVLIFNLSFIISKAQYFPIPDANFAAWLHANGYDSCMVGNNLDTICSMSFHQPTNDLNLSNLGITNPAGLQYISWCAPLSSCFFKTINLSHNNLTQIPVELVNQFSNYLSINISYNHIDTLTLGPIHYGLKQIDASHNNMQVFRKDTQYTPFTITGLNLDYNNLTSFPYFYSNNGSGYGLSIRHNQLTSIPTGNYTSLNCGANQITSASGINSLASVITIDSNLITSWNMAGLGNYWHVIYRIDCSHNQITSITNVQFPSMSLNGNVGTFLCNDNNITGPLPHLPTDIRVLDCHNNPNLTCIANLPNVTSFQLNYSNTAIQCLPRQFPNCVYNATPSINAVPTCDLYNNSYGCPQYSNMEGIVYSDVDSDCVIDSAEWKLGYLKAKFLHNGVVGQQIYTGWNGHYSFDEVNLGTYTLEIDTANLPIAVHCPDSAYYSAVVDSQKLYQTGFDFGMNCRSGFDVGDAGLVAPMFLPHSTSTVSFTAGDLSQQYGFHCAAGISGQVQLNYSGPITYTGSIGGLAPSNVTGNTLTWNIADFGTLDIYTAFRLNFYTDSLAQLHDMVCFSIHVTPVTGDIFPGNNSFYYCDEIHVAYDPNDKAVYPSGEINDSTKTLTYTIRFQNTGTAPAQHVLLVDTLDSNLDFTTFQLLNFSHPNITQISENGIVKFNFPNINLPDSNANEPASHGYVQYSIKLKDNLLPGTHISNTAYIYFDFNVPVVTNTVGNTIANVTSVSAIAHGSEVRIYPNPATNQLTITTNNSAINANVTITSATGAVVLQTTLSHPAKNKIDISKLAAGFYFLSWKDESGTVVKRFVKQ